MYFNKKSHGDQIVGIWFNDTFSFLQATQIITKHLAQLKNSEVGKLHNGLQSNNKLQPNKNSKKISELKPKPNGNLKIDQKSTGQTNKGQKIEQPLVQKSFQKSPQISEPNQQHKPPHKSSQKTVEKPDSKSFKKIDQKTASKSVSKTDQKLTIKSDSKTNLKKSQNQKIKLLQKPKLKNSVDIKEQTTKEDTPRDEDTEEDSILKTLTKKQRRASNRSNRSRSNSKNGNIDIITDISGLKPNEPLIVHQLFKNMTHGSSPAEKSKSKKKRKGSGSDKPDIQKIINCSELTRFCYYLYFSTFLLFAMLQQAESKSKIDTPTIEESTSGTNILDTLSKSLVEPPIETTPKRKNKKTKKQLILTPDALTSKNIKPKIFTATALQNKNQPSFSDNDDIPMISKLLSPQVFKDKTKLLRENDETQDEEVPSLKGSKLPLELLLGKKLQIEESYESTPPEITAESVEDDDISDHFEDSTQDTQGTQDSQISPISRELLRDTLIDMLRYDDDFVDRIHEAYISRS